MKQATRPIAAARLAAFALVAPVVLCFCSGCPPKDQTATPQAVRLPPPTLPMAEVVEQINKNNQGVPTIWAQHYFDATIYESAKDTSGTFVNGRGILLYRRPDGFTLTGKKEIGDIFEVGSDQQNYWLKLAPGSNSRLWYGQNKNLGKPCVQNLPIQPNLVMEVLGVGLIDANFRQLPAPVMRYNPEADAYMFLWVAPAGGPGLIGPARLVAQREIWYDRETFLPYKVILFDPNGRVLLHALLSKHKPVEENGPRVATEFRMFFPENRSRMSITIEDLRLSKGNIPAKRGIVFPGATREEAGVNEVIKLDKDCTD